MVPVAVLDKTWLPVMVVPITLVAQANCLSGSSEVTVQTLERWAGCLTRAQDPTAIGPVSSRSTLVMVEVWSGHDSTSSVTSHTRAIGASISILFSILIGRKIPYSIYFHLECFYDHPARSAAQRGSPTGRQALALRGVTSPPQTRSAGCSIAASSRARPSPWS